MALVNYEMLLSKFLFSHLLKECHDYMIKIEMYGIDLRLILSH